MNEITKLRVVCFKTLLDYIVVDADIMLLFIFFACNKIQQFESIGGKKI